MKKFIVSFVIFCLGATVATSKAEQSVKYENGITNINFIGGNVKSFIVAGHRENYNAHSFEVISFYVVLPTKEVNLVPIFTKEKEELNLSVSGGADCVLHDFRLLAGHEKVPATLIVADREFGETFVTPGNVIFTYFTLEQNLEQIAGFPPYSFVEAKKVKSLSKYCSVGKAFEKELGFTN